jgi:hypothetical protein
VRHLHNGMQEHDRYNDQFHRAAVRHRWASRGELVSTAGAGRANGNLPGIRTQAPAGCSQHTRPPGVTIGPCA